MERGGAWDCLVCGHPGLEEDPRRSTHEICPCCGTQFGYDDAQASHAELRQAWLDPPC